MSQCKIEGCDKTAYGRGWCPMHYRRWKKYGDPLTVKQQQNHGLSPVERLMARRELNGQCWEWTGNASQETRWTNTGTLPMFILPYPFVSAFPGPIPTGMYVCHRCDNPKCFRPEHLFLGDQQMNMDDKMKKKRHRYGVSRGAAHGCSKLTDQQVREIRASEGPSRVVAEQYGISSRQVRDIQALTVWKHLR